MERKEKRNEKGVQENEKTLNQQSRICKEREKYREWCDKEKVKHEKEEEEKISQIKTEIEAQKYINTLINVEEKEERWTKLYIWRDGNYVL